MPDTTRPHQAVVFWGNKATRALNILWHATGIQPTLHPTGQGRDTPEGGGYTLRVRGIPVFYDSPLYDRLMEEW